MPVDDEEYRRWFEALPPHVQPIASKYPPAKDGVLLCYRSTEHARLHYTIRSYSENPNGTVTVTLVHGSDSSLPGIATFGQDPAQLLVCGCGKWEFPTDEQIAATASRLANQLKRPGRQFD